MHGRRGRVGFGVTDLQNESPKPRSQAHAQGNFPGGSTVYASRLEVTQLVHRDACQVREHAMAVYDVFDTNSIRMEGCKCHVLCSRVKPLQIGQ